MTTEPIAVDVPKALAGLAGLKPGPTPPTPKPGDKADPAKPADGNAPAPGKRTFIGWVAASVTKKQLKIGAAALCSLIAGVSAVRLIWTTNDEKPPERSAQLLLTEPAKEAPKSQPGPTIEQERTPERITSPAVPTTPPGGGYWGAGSPSPAPPAPTNDRGLPPSFDITLPTPPTAAGSNLPAIPAIPGADAPKPKDSSIPSPDSLIPGAAPIVPAGGPMPPGGGIGASSGSPPALPALPTPPSSTPTSPGLPGLPALPASPAGLPTPPDASAPKPSIPAPDNLGFGGPKPPTDPKTNSKTDSKIEPKPPATVSSLPVPPAVGPVSASPPPGPGATSGAIPPPASLTGDITPVPPPSNLAPTVPDKPADKPADTPRIEISKPANSTTVTPIAGNVPERTPTTTYDVDIYHPKAGDTYESISNEFFNDAKYAAALRYYNKNKRLTEGTVDVPPIHVLKRLAVPQPQSGVGAGTPVSRSASDPWVAAGTSPTIGAGNTYRVPRGGTTLKAVAEAFLGSDQRWEDLWKLNPHLSSPNDVPEGTELKLPADARARQ